MSYPGGVIQRVNCRLGRGIEKRAATCLPVSFLTLHADNADFKHLYRVESGVLTPYGDQIHPPPVTNTILGSYMTIYWKAAVSDSPSSSSAVSATAWVSCARIYLAFDSISSIPS